MVTAVISDLHLGTRTKADLLARPEVRDRLIGELESVDQVVLLGDSIELRDKPPSDALAAATSFFEDLGEALSGRRVVLVPGNHDHALSEPWLARLRLDGETLPSDVEWPVTAEDGAAGRLAAWMPDCEVTLAYPGLRLRPDVYATHGHYLDLHLTVPRIEAIAASAMGRVTGLGKSPASATEYETVLAPMYAFYAGLAQGASAKVLARGGSLSRTVWKRVASDSDSDGALTARASAVATRFLLGRVTIPGAVAALNGLGLGPFSATLTGEELRRSGLLAMGRVAEVLAPGAEHVIFGHTHRPGPLEDDEVAEWTTISGTRLWNSGSWLHEGAFVRAGRKSPYWPGTVLTVEDEGPPRLENVLAGARGE